MSLQEPNFPSEMSSIPYDEIIGAPLTAAVNANTEASRAAADFIRDVAFQENQGFSFSNARTPRYVTFNYSKTVTDENGNSSEEEFELEIPLLLLLHVPYFEVENVTIDFNVKLNSVRKRMISEDGGGSLGLGGGIPWFSVSGSYQRTDKRSQTVERTYDQSVHVQAGSIEPPEGVTRLLDVLEETITEDDGTSNTNNNSNNSSNG
jgi:hypothetical protein